MVLKEFNLSQDQRLEDTITLRAVDALPVVIVIPVKEMSNTITEDFGSRLPRWLEHANSFATHEDVDKYSLDNNSFISYTIRIMPPSMGLLS